MVVKSRNLGALAVSLPNLVCDQDALKKIKKIKLVNIYKFKKYGFVKLFTLIFVLNFHFCFRKKKN